MATYETRLSSGRGAVVGPGWSREKIVIPAIVAVPAAAVDNADDDIGLFYPPVGFVVTGATLRGTDMDAATSPALVVDVGIAGTEELFIANATVGQGGITSTLAAAGFMYKFTSKTQVRLYISTAAGSAVAGTFYFVLEGFVDPEFSTTGVTATAA